MEQKHTLSISAWNINGYTANNHIIREEIINFIDSDIFFVSETHLKKDQIIDMDQYEFISQVRKNNIRKKTKKDNGWNWISHKKTPVS